jgi:electron transfer flavoprotein alpha/beta subunit
LFHQVGKKLAQLLKNHILTYVNKICKNKIIGDKKLWLIQHLQI